MPSQPRKRIRHFTSGDRAAHRVFERSRREAFREKLIELAELLPSLEESDVSRLSKHMVVHESIARHKEQTRQIDALKAERDDLLAEVNRWRAQAGFEPAVAREALATADTVDAGPSTTSSMESMGAGLNDLASDNDELNPLPPAAPPAPVALMLDQDDHTVPLPLGDDLLGSSPPALGMDMAASEPNASWPWATSLPLPWSDLDGADIGQLVLNAMAPPVPPVSSVPLVPPVQLPTDEHREMNVALTVDSSHAHLHPGLVAAEPNSDRQLSPMLWMVS